jgi:hypothetical protein
VTVGDDNARVDQPTGSGERAPPGKSMRSMRPTLPSNPSGMARNVFDWSTSCCASMPITVMSVKFSPFFR